MRLLPAGAPRLGLGLAALGRPGYITLNRGADIADRSVEAMRARAEEVLDAAYAGGVRWFDCARSYGLSEDFVGKWLEKRETEAQHDALIGEAREKSEHRIQQLEMALSAERAAREMAISSKGDAEARLRRAEESAAEVLSK